MPQTKVKDDEKVTNDSVTDDNEQEESEESSPGDDVEWLSKCWPRFKCFIFEVLSILNDLLDIYRAILYGCIVILFAWCAYNVWVVFADYKLYDTIITLDRELPDRTNFPGITICGRAIFTPETLANLYPEFNESYRQFLRDQYRDPQINTTESMDERYQLFRHFESKALRQFTGTEVISSKSVKLGDLVRWCRFSPINIRSLEENWYPSLNDNTSKAPYNCEQIKKPMPILYDGQKCFMYFSDLNDMLPEWQHYKPPIMQNLWLTSSPTDNFSTKTFHQNAQYSYKNDIRLINIKRKDLKQMKFVLNPHISMQINMHNHIWDYIGDRYGTTTITVHPPNILPNRRRFRALQVQRSSFYEVSFTKKITVKMPSPYKTKCINYANDSLFGHYRTQDMCTNICIKQFAYQLDGCATYYMALSTRMFITKENDDQHDLDEPDYICDHDHQNYTSFLKAENHCQDKCPAECIQELFQLNGRIDPVMSIYRWPFLDDPETHTIVVIKISPVPFAKTVHKARVNKEELIGTIGGHMGIWLGLSIYALIAFIVHTVFHLIRTICKCLWFKVDSYYNLHHHNHQHHQTESQTQ